MTAKEVTGVLPILRLERLQTLVPRRKMEGKSSKARRLNERPDSRAFGKTPDGTVVPRWHNRERWSSHQGRSMKAAIRSEDSLRSGKTPDGTVWPQRHHRMRSTSAELQSRATSQICLGTTKPQMARCRHRGGTVRGQRPSRTAARTASAPGPQIWVEEAKSQMTRCCHRGSTVFSLRTCGRPR